MTSEGTCSEAATVTALKDASRIQTQRLYLRTQFLKLVGPQRPHYAGFLGHFEPYRKGEVFSASTIRFGSQWYLLRRLKLKFIV